MATAVLEHEFTPTTVIGRPLGSVAREYSLRQSPPQDGGTPTYNGQTFGATVERLARVAAFLPWARFGCEPSAGQFPASATPSPALRNGSTTCWNDAYS